MSFQNVFACLVHEQVDCVIDLVKNLRCLDPASKIILYNGSNDPHLLAALPFTEAAVLIHPTPQPMQWGWLHHFAIDTMEYALQQFAFDTLTIVDSDQLLIGRDYTAYLQAFLQGRDHVGMLGKSAVRQHCGSNREPIHSALREAPVWRTFLATLPGGPDAFLYWTFWPTTVFTHNACTGLVDIFRHHQRFQQLLADTKIWATEEVLLPTLVKALGYDIVQNPCVYDYVKYRTPYSMAALRKGLARKECFWMHPVPRKATHSIRLAIAQYFNHYEMPVDDDVT